MSAWLNVEGFSDEPCRDTCRAAFPSRLPYNEIKSPLHDRLAKPERFQNTVKHA